jgi:NADPH:quinone reductase-like Zn-dependent oxidoreductase
MKAFLTQGDGIAALQLKDLAVPVPGPGQVVVNMRAVALNYRDLLVVKGIGGWKPPSPRLPVSDGVGIVSAVGSRVSRFAVGDRVAGIFLPKWHDGPLTPETASGSLGGAAADGVLAEYVLFDPNALVGVPAHLTDAEAATLPVAAVTAWHAVFRRSRVRPGETVLIQGTGGVSLFALQFVHALGGRPLVISSSDKKLERAAALGAEGLVNYHTFPNWEEKVLQLTGGVGVDHVIEVVGGSNLNRSLEVVRVSGAICFIGLIAGMAAPVNTFQFVQKNVELHGIETGSRAMFEEMNAFIGEHRLRPVIDTTFDFHEFPAALTYLESGNHFGKVVLTFPPE